VPEGDTIFRAARTLDRALSGKEARRLATASLRDRGPLRDLPLSPDAETTVRGVEARGKHLQMIEILCVEPGEHEHLRELGPDLSRVAFYGRAGRPCRACGARIRSRRQGENARTTYWCQTCQPSLASRLRPEGAVGTGEA
jgi:formamidopyrimidine-DNA glycosylase